MRMKIDKARIEQIESEKKKTTMKGLQGRYVKLRKKQKNTMNGQSFKKNEVLYVFFHNEDGLTLIDPRNPLRRLSIKFDKDILDIV